MRRLNIYRSGNKEVICWWNNVTQEIKYSGAVIEAFTKIGKQGELEQIAAWCSID